MNETQQGPSSLNLGFLEELYSAYLQDPNSFTADWQNYFAELANGNAGAPPPRLGPSFRPTSVFHPVPLKRGGNGSRAEQKSIEAAIRQDRVDQLVRSFRVRGHMLAQIDPLGLPRPPQPELTPEFHGFTEADLNRSFSAHDIGGAAVQTLGDILTRLRNTYCRWIGVQFMHIDDLSVRRWLQDRMESTENRIALGRKEQLRIFTRLTDAVTFEEFIQRKFVGAKSFSLEGAESLIPLLDLAIEKAGEQGVHEIVLAMAHRGRLNVLANIMGKSAQDIFREFEDVDPQLHKGRGDVKYHLGYSSDWTTSSGNKVHLSLCFNPSHLEFVSPVAIGRMRAKQDRAGDKEHRRGLALVIHGDAAFAGEGVVQETFNISQLPGYTVGGTLHIVINNQIGFTTPPSQARSSVYATDVAKMLQIPNFHVNGEDPEAVAQVVRLAMDFRAKFQRDVVIDMYCYRRRGHNEGDEPNFTQPLLYQAIQQRKSVREGYLDHLLKLGGMTREEADRIASDRRERLEADLSVARSDKYVHRSFQAAGIWSGYHGGRAADAKPVDTRVDRTRLSALLTKLSQHPADFHPHAKIERLLKAIAEMAEGNRPLDWSAAEAAAFATLATEGCKIRLSGQDSERGTFSQRHAVLHDVVDGHRYMALEHLSPEQAPVEIFNSALSEAAVMGFDYGYSLDWPDGLILWEAQFGDFSNVAQVVIDQFIASAEEKWRRLSGIVLLLPHGFEGMGPEHSSARLERFLTLAASDNMLIVNPTTPAQYFHMLRRQALWRWRKPLVVMTPKSLLRHPKVTSTLDELASGAFQPILADNRGQATQTKRVLMCSGKIYYELETEREQRGRSDIAILRLEQLYPLSDNLLTGALAAYSDGTPVVWVQEEPENMGAWRYLRCRFGETLCGRFPFSVSCRPASGSPATGSASSHKLEQKEIIMHAFGD
jgi:2-oxoglutarate dehydrogenase E1 component